MCRTCGTQPLENARFCHFCGALITAVIKPAEYKQVTVLFDGCAAVVQRYGGTVDKFTGDGIMAVFGAPVALEDHAFRACMAALEIQRGNAAADDPGVQLRVGLNSGEVVVGEIGSGPGSYTAIGHVATLGEPNEDGYRDYAARYLKRATEVGYEGHMALAEAMT